MRRRKKKGHVPWRLGGLLAVFFVLAGVAWHLNTFGQLYSQLASVFFVDSSTPQSLHVAYANARAGGQKFKILIVPGHDDQYSGTSYGGIREADLALQLGTLLAAQFAQDSNVEVDLARTDAGYARDIAQYFVDHKQDIINYRASQTTLMQKYIASGQIQSDVIVDHNKALDTVALRLYGLNLWANAHDYQLLIHIHFNDIPRANRAKPGRYTGFAIYTPEHQFSNAKGSYAVAEAVKERLAEAFHVSTLPAESVSPTEDQQLIAIGSNNSLDAASMLVEYAYIYEPSIQKASTRQATLETMAEKTYAGVEDFLESSVLVVK